MKERLMLCSVLLPPMILASIKRRAQKANLKVSPYLRNIIVMHEAKQKRVKSKVG